MEQIIQMTEEEIVGDALNKARAAMFEISNYSQSQIDRVVKAIGWAIYKEENARLLAEMSVEDTGLGNVKDKITKNQRKTLGTLNELLSVKTVGQVSEDSALGLVEYAKPVGIVGTLTPSTNPAATPANQAMMAVKGANSIIISPSPTGARTARMLVELIREELDKIRAPKNLVQVLPGKVSFTKAQLLMESVDLLLVTGDQKNVRNGYKSGTPCIGVGKGNVPVIIDKSADLPQAAEMVAMSKTFDNATSCSSENSLIIDDAIYEDFISELEIVGAKIVRENNAKQVEDAVFKNGGINKDIVGKDISIVGHLADISLDQSTKFIAVEQSNIGVSSPLSGEKLCLVLTIYRAENFEDALRKTEQILDYEGIGHSVGLHCQNPELPNMLASKINVARVLVNQAHTFGNGGGFNNSLPFTLSMGCGTWAGNSISENLSIKHFTNKTLLVKIIEEEKISADEIFAEVI